MRRVSFRRLAVLTASLAFLFWSAVVAMTLLFAIAPLFLISPLSHLKLVCHVQEFFLYAFVWVLELVVGIRVKIKRGPRNEEEVLKGVFGLPSSEGIIGIANHQTQDWAAICPLAYRQGLLGYVRTVIKQIIRYIPGFGWVMWMCYWPFVSRDFQRDERVLRRAFRQYQESSLPLQLWIFPEGTRRTPSKVALSKAHAQQQGYPPWEHVMLPRHRGFVLARHSLRGVATAVLDMTLGYAGWSTPIPRFMQLLCEPSRERQCTVHAHVVRIPIEEVPQEAEAVKRWLHQRFAIKEELLEYFRLCGEFPGETVDAKAPGGVAFWTRLGLWATLCAAEMGVLLWLLW